MNADQQHRWSLACTAITLLKRYPTTLKGLLVKTDYGPVQQAYVAKLTQAFNLTAVPVSVSMDRLNGAMDLSLSLASGKPVYQKGLLQDNNVALMINGAERLQTTISACLSQWLDNESEQNSTVLICLDESSAQESGMADSALADKLTLFVTLPDLSLTELAQLTENKQCAESELHTDVTATIDPDDVELPYTLIKEMALLAQRLGVTSLRALIQASRVAKAHAACHARVQVSVEDAAIAAQLVLAPRAIEYDETDSLEETPQEPPQHPDEHSSTSADDSSENPVDNTLADPANTDESERQDLNRQEQEIGEQLLAAAAACLPQNLIADLVRGDKRKGRAGRDASKQGGKGTHGRPCGVRRPRGGVRAQRLNILETLKAAAPRQRLRGNHQNEKGRLQIRTEDFRITQYKQPTRTTTVFVVDASGSAALHRLGEAKGAIELLLAECYVRRDRVAMISFRAHHAQLTLAPTRSLVRAKRELANLPAGGATPLAAGMDMALDVVRQLEQAGEKIVLVVMTDGKANMTRAGEALRSQAQQEAQDAARALAISPAKCILIDTAPRPRPAAAEIASALQARYLPLPSVDTRQLPQLINS